MRDPAFSDLCVDAKADAALRLLDGGYLRIYDGLKPDWPDDRVLDQVCLAVLAFGTPAFAPSRKGRASAYAFLPRLADRQGTPAWFRTFTAAGQVMFDGTVGLRDARTNDGDREEYDMYVDGDLFEGGEVTVETFDYVERKR